MNQENLFNTIKQLYIEDVILMYALKNSIEHNGMPNEKAIFNSVMGHFKKPLHTKETIKDWYEKRLPEILGEKYP